MPKNEPLRRIDAAQPTGTTVVGGGVAPGFNRGVLALTDAASGLAQPDGTGRVTLRGAGGLVVTATGSQIVLETDASIAQTAITGRLVLGVGAALGAPLADTGVQLYLVENILTAGDAALLQARGVYEYLQVTDAGVSDGALWRYPVTRAYLSPGPYAWRKGDMLVRLGANGEKTLELYAEHALEGVTGPGLVIRRATSGDPDAWTPVALLGNLRGRYGLSAGADAWGLGAGAYGAGGWFTVDDAHGLRVGAGSQVTGEYTPDGDIKQYSGGVQRSHFDAAGSGWISGQDKIFWDTAGNLTVAGKLTSGTGSVIDGAHIVANTVTAEKLSVTFGGANLVENSTFDRDTDANGVADDWAIYSLSESATGSRPTTGGVDNGPYQRVSWTGTNTTLKGVYRALTGWRSATTYTVSFYARASVAAMYPLLATLEGNQVTTVVAPNLTTNWQRYVFRVTTLANFTDANIYLWTPWGAPLTGSLDIDHCQVEEGDVVTGWKPLTGEAAPGSITADALSVNSLSAITGNMGGLNAGQIVIGESDKLWLNDANDGALHIGGNVKGAAPFRVTAAGELTAANARITGALQASVFEKSSTSVIAGGLIVAKGAGTLDTAYTVGGTLVLESPPAGGWLCDTGDVVRIRAAHTTGTGDTWLTVTRTGTENQYTTTYQSGTNSVTYPAGTAVVNYGQSGQGYFGVAADGSFGANAAWVLRSHDGTPWVTETTHVYAGTDGKLYAGGGNVTLDNNGITATAGTIGGFVLSSGKLSATDGTFFLDATNKRIRFGAVYIDSMSGITEAALGAQLPISVPVNISSNLTVTGGKLTTGSGSLLQGETVYSGALKAKRDNVDHTGYIFVPLTEPKTHTSYDGDAVNVGTYTLDLQSADWGSLPAAIKAVSVRMSARWAAASNASVAMLLPAGSSGTAAMVTRASAAGIAGDATGIVPTGTNGDLTLEIAGANSDSVFVQIWGYYI